ncbi:abc transport system substrate-binding protein [Pseudomonas saudimassiliensis]|uniref:Abc transport system substrate-binding protein n=1 Tax=Pseudomonas saudimassiliensis TaxID=1461581 RepID=A0A078M775_9PSED|nr:hypothetical protein [Pseudomonas saudimassiliensis]CEA01192.1 abc transport system substrate-binding protein [Pseudomonas saudimassiliensis]CEF25429.1 abc transport system substrate-binding protein [Pseudomonas saudimassiliensis]
MRMPRLLMLALAWLLSMGSWADTIGVVIPQDTVLTRSFVEALASRMPADRLEVHVLGIPQVPDSASLLVTMGQEALQWRLAQSSQIPTIATYVTLDGLRELHDSVRPSSVQILLASAKPDRQLRLAQLLIPHMNTAGLLFSEQQQWQQRFWQAAAARQGVTLYARGVAHADELPRRLSDVLNQSDVLVGLDDPALYNAENLKTLLLTSYARRRVLIGPSAPFIAAGSLSTTYSTPENMAESVIAAWRQPWKPAAIRYPEQFSVLSNDQVAHSLGLPPPDDGELMRRILAMEQTR